VDALARRILEHYRAAGRELPWRKTRDPYAIWVCEIMAQQTRIATVLPYWERWMARFPTVSALAAAEQGDVLAMWAGLGYYARARSLHKAAQAIVARHGGTFPTELAAIEALPGIGPYTAGAIASIAFGTRAPLVDGNVARVFARLFGIEDDVALPATRRRLWDIAAGLVPADDPGGYNQGLMDLGATICTPRAPRCGECPVATDCVARRTDRAAALPLLVKKTRVREVEARVAWIARGGEWLVARRAPDGLFGGLWELPEASALGLTLDGPVLAEHTAKLSHRTIRYLVLSGRAPGKIHHQPPYDHVRWCTPDELETLGVSAATSALVQKLKEIRWPTPTAPSSSSRRVSTRSSPGSTRSATTRRTTTSRRRPAAPRRRSARWRSAPTR
jgi:A/G-specific adenine glycosylase